MRVLVTGATGFVGWAVADRLRRDAHEVWGLTRSDGPLPEGVGRVVGDLREGDLAFPQRFDAVCHLAALVRARESRADPVGYWRVNVGGTLAVLGALAAQEGAPARLVVASTCAVYGEHATGPIDETAQARPTSPYGSSKLAADRAVADLAATGAIGAVSLRAFNVAGGLAGHGDRDVSRLVPKAVAVARGRAAELTVNGDGSVVRDYLHVADMADAFARALDACRPGRWVAYNVGAGRRSTIADVVTAVEAVAGRPLPVRHLPPADEPPALLADAGRIERELGWRPEHSDLPPDRRRRLRRRLTDQACLPSVASSSVASAASSPAPDAAYHRSAAASSSRASRGSSGSRAWASATRTAASSRRSPARSASPAARRRVATAAGSPAACWARPSWERCSAAAPGKPRARAPPRARRGVRAGPRRARPGRGRPRRAAAPRRRPAV